MQTTTLSQMTFSYRPLSSDAHQYSLEEREIRLISLHPGYFDDPIACTIHHSKIEKRQSNRGYTALSYVWGDPTQTRPIQLGYHKPLATRVAHAWFSGLPLEPMRYETFQVTENLESALRHLRQKTVQCLLWVDAICINQLDVEECRLQVQSMGDVYSNALKVHIWLGPLSDVFASTCNLPSTTHTRETQKGNPGNQRLSSRCSADNCSLPKTNEKASSGEGSRRYPSCSESRIDQNQTYDATLSSREKIIYSALCAARGFLMDKNLSQSHGTEDTRLPDELESFGMRIITSRPWWRRVWVVQEATLAVEDPIMQCGFMTFEYRKLLNLAKSMLLNPPLEFPKSDIFLTVHRMFNKGYNPREVSLANRLLTYLGCMSGNFEATDPKDRIYGLSGLIRMGVCHDNILALITQQHDLILAELYHMIAVWILHDPHPLSRPLQLLESGPSTIESIPSWVPIWESKQWIGESKNLGAPRTKFDIFTLDRPRTFPHRVHSAQNRAEGHCCANPLTIDGCWSAINSFAQSTALRIRHTLALGQVITVVQVPTLQKRSELDGLREALVQVEDKVLLALKAAQIPHDAARDHIRKFREYLQLNFCRIDGDKEPSSLQRDAGLEDFLNHTRKSRRRKQRGVHGTNAHQQAGSDAQRHPLETGLNIFFEQVSHLVVGSHVVGHIFEDSLPSWRCGDKLYLIPECRWALGLRKDGEQYQYMYRVFLNNLEWNQRQGLFDEKGIYTDIVLI